MIRLVDVPEAPTLDDYAAHLNLAQSVAELRSAAGPPAARMRGRKVWMINSTAEGGGVAEMLPKVVALLRDLGVDTEWAVIQPDDDVFFRLTKRLHNLIHGEGDPHLGREERANYEAVSRHVADELEGRVGPEDVLIVHDPQPLGVGALLKERLGVRAVWRCHIGLDRETPETRAAWEFLAPFARAYDTTVFSLPEYIPPFLSDTAQVIHPAIDPLSEKNRWLSIRHVASILHNASLEGTEHPVLTDAFEEPAMRLQPDGTFAPADQPETIGLLYRPVVLQVSRWDRLKGFAPLMRGFVRMKRRLEKDVEQLTERHRRRLEHVRLVLAGPDPASVQDDPEGRQVFDELCDLWLELDPKLRRDVALLILPMASRRANALMVNVLQRCATVVVQNSLEEGFGLTVTEAMWKRAPVMASKAVGLRSQVRDGVEGRLVDDPEDPALIAETLDEMLVSPERRAEWAQNAQRRVAQKYLIFSQLRRYLDLIDEELRVRPDGVAA